MQPLKHYSDADNDSVLLEQSPADFPMGEGFPAHTDTPPPKMAEDADVVEDTLAQEGQACAFSEHSVDVEIPEDDGVFFMDDSAEERRADADHNNEMSRPLPPRKPGRSLNQYH